MNQMIQIDLESNNSTAYEHYIEIKEAVENASLNLYSKHNVQIKEVQVVGRQVIMSIVIPDNIANSFKIGYHLRGISAYLMKNYKEIYKPLIVGKKLLNYTIIPTQTYVNNSELTMNDRFSAISLFSELLKNSDEVSMNKINQILKILKEK